MRSPIAQQAPAHGWDRKFKGALRALAVSAPITILLNSSKSGDTQPDSPPQPDQVLVLQQWPGASELVHIAPDQAAAEHWLKTNHYSNSRVEIVGGV